MRSTVSGSFPLRTYRWLASGRWAVFPLYSYHASPSRLWRRPLLPNHPGAKDGAIKPDTTPLHDICATSPYHTTQPCHPTMSPYHINLPRHPAMSPCQITLPHHPAMSSYHVIHRTRSHYCVTLMSCWCHCQKGHKRRNCCLGSSESKSEAVFDARLVPNANRASLRKNGQNGKSQSNTVLNS